MDITVDDLRAEVEARFAGLDLPGWPAPRPAGQSPRDEEYSRLTDPARYAVVHARSRQWQAVLSERLGARIRDLPPAPGEGGRAAFDRGVEVTPTRPGGLPLLLLERDVPVEEGGTLAVLDVAVVRPEIVITIQPDCGCDACDTGSVDLLEAVDAAVASVVGGPFVALRHARWQAQWHPGGGSAGGAGRGPDFDAVMRMCERLAAGDRVALPSGVEAFVGRRWCGPDAACP